MMQELFDGQILVDEKNKRLTWNPEELFENIYLLLGLAKMVLNIKFIGAPYKVKEGIWAINYEEVSK